MSREIFFIAGDHGVDMPAFSFEQSYFCFEIFNFLGEELDEIFEILSFFLEFVFFGHVIIFE